MPQTRLKPYQAFYLQHRRIGPTLSDQLGSVQDSETQLEIRPTASDELLTPTRRGLRICLNYGDILPLEEKSETPSRISDLCQTPSAPSLSGICRSDANKAVKDAQEKLDAVVLAKYAGLSEDEINILAVDDKWFASIRSAIEGEVQRITQRLAGRVRELEERYAQTMPELEAAVGALSGKVEGHLRKMGITWQ